MEIHLDCIPCFQRQALGAARFVTDDEDLQERILRRVITVLEGMEWTSTPPEMAHVVHRIVREECGVRDPYENVKKQYNDAALELYPGMELLVRESDNPLRTGVLLAIAGNIIDLGASSKIDLEGTIARILDRGLTIDDLESLTGELNRASNILYLADNTGEIVLDKLLLRTILDLYEIDKIVFAVKGAPIINDATREDALYVGLDEMPGIEFMEVGIGMPGTGPERSSREFRKLVAGADMVISKGQGNYEALSDIGGIFFLLMAKCPVVADHLGVEEGSFILKKMERMTEGNGKDK